MNKKDVSELKRQFKFGNANLSLDVVVTGYVKVDGRVLTVKTRRFGTMEENEQELLFNNCKKLLTGTLGAKLYELPFNKEATTQSYLCGLYRSYDEVSIENMITKIATECKYTGDYVVNVVLGEYFKPIKSTKDDIEDYESPMYNFMLVTVNPMETVKKTMVFDAETKEFCVDKNINKMVNLNSPLDGFLFPAYNNFTEDVNNVLYYTNANNTPNSYFVEKFLGCNIDRKSVV